MSSTSITLSHGPPRAGRGIGVPMNEHTICIWHVYDVSMTAYKVVRTARMWARGQMAVGRVRVWCDLAA